MKEPVLKFMCLENVANKFFKFVAYNPFNLHDSKTPFITMVYKPVATLLLFIFFQNKLEIREPSL